MRDDPPLHLLIPGASSSASGWLPAMQALPPGCLGQLLQGMELAAVDTGSAESLSPPHERALARATGLAGLETPDGLIAWAAAAATAQISGKAWAWITPCHWAMGHLHATLSDPQALQLQPAESHALLALMQPYFDTDGIRLHLEASDEPDGAVRWLAEGELFRHLPTASLDRVVARNVDAWLPQASTTAAAGSAGQTASQVAARTLRRLQNEMQMLLYTHSFNDERIATGRLPVNSFWASGTGALPAEAGVEPASYLEKSAQISVPRALLRAVLREDWPGYAHAWQELDAGTIAGLLALQHAGATVRLTLCGEGNARTYVTSRRGVWRKITGLLRPFRTLDMLEQL